MAKTSEPFTEEETIASTIRMALSLVRTLRRADMGSVDLILVEVHLEDALASLARHEEQK